MAGRVGGCSVRHNVLVSPRGTFSSVSRPKVVFQDIGEVATALTSNFLDNCRIQILRGYWGQAPVHNA